MEEENRVYEGEDASSLFSVAFALDLKDSILETAEVLDLMVVVCEVRQLQL